MTEHRPENVLPVDDPAAYAPRRSGRLLSFNDPGSLQQAVGAHPDFNLDLVANEETTLGTDLSNNPEEFFRQHRALVNSFDGLLQELAPEVSGRTIEALAQYMGRTYVSQTGLDIDGWRQRLQMRAQGFGARAVDHLRSSKLGYADFDTQTAYINTVLVFLGREQAAQLVRDHLLPHEFMHLLFTREVAVRQVPSGFRPVRHVLRSGAEIARVPEDREDAAPVLRVGWVGEASLEDLRSRATGAEAVSYGRAVALLRALKAVDPGLESALDLAQLDVLDPCEVEQRIEAILGPSAREAITPYVVGAVWDPAKKAVDYVHDEAIFVAAVDMMARQDLRGSLRGHLLQQLQQVRRAIELPPHLASGH